MKKQNPGGLLTPGETLTMVLAYIVFHEHTLSP